jgi:hypothetical protein
MGGAIMSHLVNARAETQRLRQRPETSFRFLPDQSVWTRPGRDGGLSEGAKFLAFVRAHEFETLGEVDALWTRHQPDAYADAFDHVGWAATAPGGPFVLIGEPERTIDDGAILALVTEARERIERAEALLRGRAQ